MKMKQVNPVLLRQEVARFLYEEKQIPSPEFVENWSCELLFYMYNRYLDIMEAKEASKENKSEE